MPRVRKDGQLKGKKRVVTRKECQRLREGFEVGSFMVQKELWNIAKKENVGRQRSVALQERRRPVP